MKKTFLLSCLLLLAVSAMSQVRLYVAISGNDKNTGTLTSPLRTVEAAVAKALTYTNENVWLEIRGGRYELTNSITIDSTHYQLQSLTIRAYNKEVVTIAAAATIECKWKPAANGIWQTHLWLTKRPDRLFANGKPLSMARYPNYDSTARVFNGTAADAIDPARVRRWKDPAFGYVHALHNGEWGGFHYMIEGKNGTDSLVLKGGWQNNRRAPLHKQHRFVENIREELDAPGEWFYDLESQTLFVYPPKGMDIKKTGFAVSQPGVREFFRITGSAKSPIKNITVSDLHFTETPRTFMLTGEPLLRSDWTIYRGGAIYLEGTENNKITGCTFSELGGNAIFISRYNKADSITGNHIYNIGASAIAFVGDLYAVRSPSFEYAQYNEWVDMDYTPGPKTNNYPQYCVADNNLIHHIGTIEKQVAGIQISMAAHITASRNSIYHTPRAGINIGDGCWGGHILEYNDVFNTVLETGDHGAFNSWGRDRFWRPQRPVIDSIVAAKLGIELLDVIDPITIRNNRFQCDHGWDIDLDDGSSNYRIYNNVCLSGGLKLREGYHRTVTNNSIINNGFHPHVWLKNSGDVFMHNIVTTAHAPIQISNWGNKVDSNFFLSKQGLEKSQTWGVDKHSSWGDAAFENAATGNYTVKASSPALQTGFKNFDNSFGVTIPALKRLAAVPAIQPLMTTTKETKNSQVEWLGARFKNIETLGERSAAGLPDSNGALLTTLSAGSKAAASGLKKGDVIIKLDDKPVNSTEDLLLIYQGIKWHGKAACTIIRDQSPHTLSVSFK